MIRRRISRTIQARGRAMSGQIIRATSLVALGILTAGSGFAQAPQGLVAPRPLTSPQPPQPTNALDVPVEGWVTVRYSVSASGAPSNVRAVEFMPPTIDPAPTIETVSGWTFSPGMQNGRAIDWHNNESIVVFRLQSGAGQASEEYQQTYESVNALLDAEPVDYAAALAANNKLLGEYSLRLSDIGLALTQATVIQDSRMDPISALESLRLATDPRLPMLSGTELFPAVQNRLRLEFELGRIDDALASYNRLAKGLGPNQNDVFMQLGSRLRTQSQRDALLRIKGRIDSDAWRINADRRYFYLSDINGTVRSIVAECDTRRIELEFDPDTDYGLPDALGDCTIFVEGDPGTTFTLAAALPPE